MSNPIGKPKRTHSVCCEAELIITPAYPVKERVVICGSCGCPDHETSVREYVGRGNWSNWHVNTD